MRECTLNLGNAFVTWVVGNGLTCNLKWPKRYDYGLQKPLWEAADKQRSSMNAAEYKHVVLGFIFLNVF